MRVSRAVFADRPFERRQEYGVSTTSESESMPWDRPTWKPVEGKEAVLVYLVAIHLLAGVGVALFPLPSLGVFLLSLLFTALGGLGTTVCYHRALAHRSVKLDPVVEQFLIFWTIFNGSGNPTSWSANHRSHHANADSLDDISSPTHGGFWWAHLRWLYQTPSADVRRWAPDLDKRRYRAWTHAELPIILLAIFGGLLFGWSGFFWLGAIRLVYSLHLQCFVNSLTHLGSATSDGGSSQNVWWLGPFQLTAWGENWHRNHHTFANSARIGLRWWQVDVGWYAILLLESVGLASGVKRPSLRDGRRGGRPPRSRPVALTVSSHVATDAVGERHRSR
jgi:stearoyl-CoA desaturase (delta-9 desaturase)